jgi:alkylation response protein AidB-like acyl-CoA dehydrogenase
MLRFELADLPPTMHALRAEVRSFLKDTLGDRPAILRAQAWRDFDPDFSRKVGARGWIGMTWPKKWGGHERSFLERYVVTEEMLAAGAPLGAHRVADRQSGPILLRFGTEAQCEEFLPKIVRGELAFAIGMSEPDSGSDLASIRARATRTEGGFVLDGTKIWTTQAHRCQYMLGLFRTAPPTEDKHQGLSQFVIDLGLPGIAIRPILDLSGEHHFNEVVFDNVFIRSTALVGVEGRGWEQVSTELAYERSGPERYLSSIALLMELIRAESRRTERRGAVAIGRLVAHLATLRQMSLSVASMLERGEKPNAEAAVVKDLGTTFEQEIPEVVHGLLNVEPTASGVELEAVLGSLLLAAPAFSLRGGTREILRGIIARELGLR